MDHAACEGLADLFFGPDRERPEPRRRREEKARLICKECPVLLPCRTYARQHREPGFWGGESEKDREGAEHRDQTECQSSCA